MVCARPGGAVSSGWFEEGYEVNNHGRSSGLGGQNRQVRETKNWLLPTRRPGAHSRASEILAKNGAPNGDSTPREFKGRGGRLWLSLGARLHSALGTARHAFSRTELIVEGRAEYRGSAIIDEKKTELLRKLELGGPGGGALGDGPGLGPKI